MMIYIRKAGVGPENPLRPCYSGPMVISRSYEINGASQWVYVHHHPRAKSALLFLHGGPGWADAPWAGMICERLWPELTTVHWDQRGCNRSQYPTLNTSGTSAPDPGPLSIQQLVSDGIVLTQLIEREFGILRPILVGHSWGAFLGVLMAAEAPELFQHYIGIGQLVANRRSEPLSLASCRVKAQDQGRADLLSELQAMPDSFYESLPGLFRQREIVSELGGEFLRPVDQTTLEAWMFRSPAEYRSDWTQIYQGCERTCEQIWPELIRRDLAEEVRELELPVTLMQGRHDDCTPGAPVTEWLGKLSCPRDKELFWFENSAHWPQIEENEKFSQLISERAR